MLNRADQRLLDDLEGRDADVTAALELERDNLRALHLRAALEKRRGNFGSAANTYERILQIAGDQPEPYRLKGVALFRAGRNEEADLAFDRARELATSAPDLNTICWNKAVGNAALERALEECSASLQLVDSPATRDSRALVYLRLGRLEEALEEFDRALEKMPELATSLFGRAVTKARLGDLEGARVDAGNARRIWREADEAFRSFGFQIPADIATPRS